MLFAREPRVWCKALGAGQKARGGRGWPEEMKTQFLKKKNDSPPHSGTKC